MPKHSTGSPGVDRLRRVDADVAHVLVLAVDRDLDRVAVDHPLDLGADPIAELVASAELAALTRAIGSEQARHGDPEDQDRAEAGSSPPEAHSPSLKPGAVAAARVGPYGIRATLLRAGSP